MDDSNRQSTQYQWQPPGSAPGGRRRVAGIGARAATALAAFGLMAGGVTGGLLVSHAATSDTSSSSSTSVGSGATTTAPAAGTGQAPATGGRFTPNENATHEAGESAAREAQENAGQMPTVP